MHCHIHYIPKFNNVKIFNIFWAEKRLKNAVSRGFFRLLRINVYHNIQYKKFNLF